MTVTKQKKNIGQVTKLMISKKNTDTGTAGSGNKVQCTMSNADNGDTVSCCKLVVCKVPTEKPAQSSTANKHKEQFNVKLNLSIENATQSTQTNALKIKSDDPELKRARANDRINDKVRGKVIDLDKLVKKQTTECGVQAARSDLGVKRDGLDTVKNYNINFVNLADDDFAQSTIKFRNMRDAMLNNFNQTINAMNEQYERRMSSQFRLE